LASRDLTDGPVLVVDGVAAGYRRRPVVHGVSLSVNRGEIVSVLGHNGAGKTTTLKTIFGLLQPIDGRVLYQGSDVSSASPAQHVRLGMSYIPAEQFLFPNLSVAVNLRLAALQQRSSATRQLRLDRVYEMFPILAERCDQLAGTFSGGEQRILGVGMALMSDPQLMLFDEPSLGVSPAIMQQILTSFRRLADERGCAVVLVEQNVGHALREADRVYVMRSGRVLHEEPASAMRRREHYWDLF
jgi:branched-chain amino acid transport system ATP-binding protein